MVIHNDQKEKPKDLIARALLFWEIFGYGPLWQQSESPTLGPIYTDAMMENTTCPPRRIIYKLYANVFNCTGYQTMGPTCVDSLWRMLSISVLEDHMITLWYCIAVICLWYIVIDTRDLGRGGEVHGVEKYFVGNPTHINWECNEERAFSLAM